MRSSLGTEKSTHMFRPAEPKLIETHTIITTATIIENHLQHKIICNGESDFLK